jgi:hypothetical protein
VIIRDTIPITVQQWNEPKKTRLGASFVDKRSKKDLWKKLMENFIQPPEYSKKDDDGNEIRVDVKGEGESNISLSRRWLKHSRATRKCYT